jgi:hypothetical protein
MLGYGLDPNGYIARAEVDRRRAVGLGETEERVGHEILCVSRREVARERAEQLELLSFRSWAMSRRHDGSHRND